MAVWKCQLSSQKFQEMDSKKYYTIYRIYHVKQLAFG